MQLSKKQGFTLVEIIVVITLIATLTIAVMSIFANQTPRARDARRRADLKQVQKALEQYYAANNAYPPNPPGTCSDLWSTTTYLPNGQPKDPRGTTYVFACNSDLYCVCTQQLEETGSGNATNNSCAYGTGNYFCVSNQQ
ncbi:hypothetical protein A3A66_02230 [Microgenomates group bacterium RIFCSPLOWO2_01_FULL_46_13]|nr:MAG: hypothetical protein A2783_02000 [Microgenomates group bacterium RIFCSPHIGHO2_01_FULL_45_11]OGV94794.1 MAG: hypothetical protein A3A66_02230 [Microgenomates group bacterium RIFCSPLOWO2_01_FULL_46_13]